MSADKVSETKNDAGPSIEDVINNPVKSNRKEINKKIEIEDLKSGNNKWQCVDGCYALTDAAYRLTDSAFIFPITPASLMSEYADSWSANDRKNIFGQTVQVTQMNSEAGAAGAVHGALVVGGVAYLFSICGCFAFALRFVHGALRARALRTARCAIK